jgi:leader peptidase (prepilin peptidase)/N-methyltransferase
MDALTLLHEQPALFLLAVGLLGLVVGSFLNVVIHRLPVMMERQWRAQCEQWLSGQDGAPPPERFDLVQPRSRCPQCGHTISAWENIPVLSYVMLRGKCSACGKAISLRYPIVELLTAALSVAVAWRFGLTWQTGLALLLTWALLSASFVDLDHQLLPDAILLPTLWLGLLASLFGVFQDSRASIIGAVAGYLSLWSVYHVFRWLTGKEGMGYGDFKLFALLGAWLGWQSLPLVILLSSLVGASVGIVLILAMGRDRNLPIPFGPYLAGAGWITLLWGQDILHWYSSAWMGGQGL